MAQENKHGRYDKFDLNKARWECPACGGDSLMIETKAVRSPNNFSISHSFVCEECEFNSLDHGFNMKAKESFNSAHRKLMDIWFYLLVAQKKSWEDGFDTGLNVAKCIQKGYCDEL